ncbi:hypothetical protein RFI_39284 [Reticulomyxa filosa]|uniref:Uncharacterized protein n=1 Tax=Reticulomyxa filosa TaxID=46433 RepID=X6LAR2_RETFI|nr:hypothetical protein RFI_39284 [Reticulomyxa filosa]|eukprot:ETN98226.1 hypothetical protein RFI_39284 [Reticulomyxa filosa]
MSEEAFFKSLLEECISSFVPSSKSKNDDTESLVRMSQSKHPLEYVQEHLRMIREIIIDKKNLDHLNYHETFYMCDITDNLQYWMIIVEKESFVVCYENSRLLSHNILSSLQFFKLTHHNITPICLDTTKSVIVYTTDVNIVVLMGRRTRVPTTSFETYKKKIPSLFFFFLN